MQKNGTGVTLNFSSNAVGDGTSFTQNLLLANT